MARTYNKGASQLTIVSRYNAKAVRSAIYGSVGIRRVVVIVNFPTKYVKI
jgi:hypothetical protein